MQVAFCENCGKHTGHKRNVGIIGKVTALATVGANYLAYTPRCVICGLTAAEAHSVTPAVQDQIKRGKQRRKDMEDEIVRGIGNALGAMLGAIYKALYAFSYWAASAICADYLNRRENPCK
jgi:hypothetical protein